MGGAAEHKQTEVLTDTQPAQCRRRHLHTNINAHTLAAGNCMVIVINQACV